MYLIYDNINNYDENKYNEFYSNLKDCDKSRIKHYVYERDKQLFILSRVLLIRLLKDNYSLDYYNLEIKYNSYNKPYIDNIYFNISHSYDFAVVVSNDKKIGVDIEKVRVVDINIINYFCTNSEKNYILNSKNKYKSLFEIFCLKEAYFKMLGTDLSDMKNIEFSIYSNKIYCSSNNNLNIILDYSIDGYIIAVIEEKD